MNKKCMIDPKDLRIGNWVYPNDENATPYPVLEILTDKFLCYRANNRYPSDRGDYVKLSDSEPIPLTPEILEKCGFVEESKCWWEKDGFQILLGYTEEFGDFFHYTSDHVVLSTAYKYLHQLQNLYFALTGEELKYNP
jgi:hypothetical protein